MNQREKVKPPKIKTEYHKYRFAFACRAVFLCPKENEMADEYITMDISSMQRQLDEIERKLTDIDRGLRNNIMNDVLKDAAGQLHNEQKRILSTAPSEGIRSLASDLSVWKDNTKPMPGKVSYRAGYSADKIRHSIKYFVIEYGRPGKRHKKGIDKLGRRIGRVVPFSHIRAAWFLKRAEINRYIAERIDAEILERWNR